MRNQIKEWITHHILFNFQLKNKTNLVRAIWGKFEIIGPLVNTVEKGKRKDKL